MAATRQEHGQAPTTTAKEWRAGAELPGGALARPFALLGRGGSPVRAAAILALASVATLACGGDDAAPSSGWDGTVRDSAGVTIVENPSTGLWGASSPWSVEEVFRVGGLDADTESQFAMVVGVDVDDDGRVYVADQQARRILVFGADGSFLRSLGTPGEGPGELGPGMAGVFEADGRLRVPDLTNQRINLYDPQGESLGSLPFMLSQGVPFRWDELGDGTLVVQRRGMAVEGMAELAQGDPLVTVPMSEEAEADTLAFLPKGRSFDFSGGQPRMTIFDPEPVWDVADDGSVARGMNSDFRVEIWRDGAAEQVVTLPREPVEVTENEERRLLEFVRDQMTQGGAPPQAVEVFLQGVSFADSYPALAQVLLAPDGHLWVQRIYTSRDVPEGVEWSIQDLGSNEWDIFDSQGRYLGVLALPLRFQALRLLDGVIWGVQRDELDVASVVGLRLTTG